LRWKIEVFHKILKSGCRAEQSRLMATARQARTFTAAGMAEAIHGLSAKLSR
jgi:hypothetical protein